jgi:quercetin dioxygenase-like cupin family protein
MEWASGNIFIRPNPLPKAGDQVQGHAHNFDHTTIAFKGAIRVKRTLTDGTVQTVDLVAPAHCLIEAGVEHEITALEDNSVFWCVYSHREPQGDIVQDVTGWSEAYQ